jgi:hypothetical protein
MGAGLLGGEANFASFEPSDGLLLLRENAPVNLGRPKGNE